MGARSTERILIGWAVWLLFGVNAAVIVWLWWRGGGISSVRSLATFLTSAGRITGLLGAYLLLVQLLLLARIPLLERMSGFDRLTLWHRWNGIACLWLVVGHTGLITLGYMLTDRISLWSEITTLLETYPGMVTATVGTGLLVLVAVSSFVIVRRRLRYEFWYLVHLTAYAGILLAWFHQVPTGNELAVDHNAAAYWTGLYLVTLVAVVLFRFVQPVVLGLWYRLHVAEVVEERPGIVSVRIVGRHLDRLDARPGQFMLWRFFTRHTWWEAHPFSLSEAPNGNSLRITVKDLGDFTSRLSAVKPGTVVAVEGPFGRFTEEVRRRDRVAFIAGGIGITPIRALLETIQGDAVLVYRVVREEDVIFGEELEAIAHETQLRVHYVVGDHRSPGGDRFLSPEHLSELVPDLATRDVYICGPAGLALLIEKNARAAGVPANQIHCERFSLAT